MLEWVQTQSIFTVVREETCIYVDAAGRVRKREKVMRNGQGGGVMINKRWLEPFTQKTICIVDLKLSNY